MAPPIETIFTVQTPASTNNNDGPYTLGTLFTSSLDGAIIGIRWYGPSIAVGGPVIGLLYEYTTETTGVELARATFGAITAGAWNEVDFATPVGIQANKKYVAAICTPAAYVSTTNGFVSSITNGHLTAPSDDPGTPIRNGRFIIGGTPAFPTSGGSAPNYFVDVAFQAHFDAGTGSDTSQVWVTTADSGAGTEVSIPPINSGFDSGLLVESSTLFISYPPVATAEGPMTILSLVDEVLDVVHGYVRAQEAKTHLTASMSNSDLTFTVANPQKVSTGLAEIDEELVYISMVDRTSGLVTVEPWGRAQSQTQAIAHAVNARVTDNPVIPRQRVRNAIWGVLREMFPAIFAFGETFLDINPVLTHYDMPDDCYHVMQVQWKLPGPTGLWAEADRWKQNKRAGSPVELELFSRVWPGQDRARVQYMKVPPVEFGISDDLGSYGYELQVRDVIVLGAAARLMAYIEPSRVLTESVVANARGEMVPAGSATAISRYLYQMFQKRIEDEREQQLFRHPLQIHFTR